MGRLGWTHKTLSRDSLSINQLGISRCETLTQINFSLGEEM